MEEFKAKHKSLQSAAHHIMALECIHPQSSMVEYALILPLIREKANTQLVVLYVITCLFLLDFVDAQSVHGSPYHVHPYPSPVRQQHAFQTSRTASASPKMFHPKGFLPHIDYRTYSTPSDSPILGRALCLTPKSSPVMGRVYHLSDKFQDSLTLNSDTEALVAKISTMFPTVSETHIKILLKKYYNREAVVISALQVEKHPITTPGPLTMSPSAARLQKTGGQFGEGSWNGSAHVTPLTRTPQDSPSLVRPASGASSNYYGSSKSQDGQVKHSPKMKLKYLKSIFPEAEETLILDVLADKENNVQKSSEKLMTMGFHKKDTPPPNPPKKAKVTTAPLKVVTIMKTKEEKNQLKCELQNKYKTIPERVVSLALESVDYNEERAEQILAVVLQEENAPKPIKPVDNVKEKQTNNIVVNVIRPILKTCNIVDMKFKSQCSTQAKGPNSAIRKGPRDCLLLDNYMMWKGPNPEYRSGSSIKVKGPEVRDRSTLSARGPNPGLAKGPAATLIKSSVYKKTAQVG